MLPILPLLALASTARALYFFIDGTTPRCFLEELPKDTLVVGNYEAQEWDESRQQWEKHDGVNIYISVDVRSTPSYAHSHRPLIRPSGNLCQ